MTRMNRKHHDAGKPQKRPNLPKAAVNILIRWLEENCTNPYPSESTKKLLMEVTRLTKNQIYNWFINSRRRILPNILKDKHVDKSLILKFPCFNRNSFAHHFEETKCGVNAELCEEQSSQTNITPVHDDYNLRLLAEVASQESRI